MDLANAADPHPLGCTIRFEVVPGSSRLLVPSGFNPWRKSLEARLTEEPTRGRANRQLIEALAEILSVPAAAIEVMSGHKNSRKVVLVRGMAADQAISLLSSKIK